MARAFLCRFLPVHYDLRGRLSRFLRAQKRNPDHELFVLLSAAYCAPSQSGFRAPFPSLSVLSEPDRQADRVLSLTDFSVDRLSASSQR